MKQRRSKLLLIPVLGAALAFLGEEPDRRADLDPKRMPSPAMGVTTAVIGNCGFTIAPCRSRDRELVMRNLTQVEGMSLEVLRQGIRWQFETIPEYLDMLERQGAAVNVAVFAGHSALRDYGAWRRGALPAEDRRHAFAEISPGGADAAQAGDGDGGHQVLSRPSM